MNKEELLIFSQRNLVLKRHLFPSYIHSLHSFAIISTALTIYLLEIVSITSNSTLKLLGFLLEKRFFFY